MSLLNETEVEECSASMTPSSTCLPSTTSAAFCCHFTMLCLLSDYFLRVRKIDQGSGTNNQIKFECYHHLDALSVLQHFAYSLWSVCIQLQTAFVLTETVNKALGRQTVNILLERFLNTSNRVLDKQYYTFLCVCACVWGFAGVGVFSFA
jgi:hypothetical protein